MKNKNRSLFQGSLIERLYHSPIGPLMVHVYDFLYRSEKLKVCRIYDDLLIEVSASKPGERGIPFYAFEPLVTQKFLSIIKEGDIVFDVGAWIGYYTILAAKKVGPKGNVVSIEPHSANIERIRRNAEINSFSNVKILDVGVADKSSTGSLLEGKSSLMNKVFVDYKNNITSEKNIRTINIETLDHIINSLTIEKISMLILDVEGYEYFALNGLKNALVRRSIENIICEIHPRMLAQHDVSDVDVIDFLSKYRYSTQLIDNQKTSRPYHILAKLDQSA